MFFEGVFDKLKKEWKTFALAVSVTLSGAWELASQWGADIPSFFQWVPENLRSGVLFAVGLGFILLRNYRPTVVEVPAAPEAPEAPTEPEVPSTDATASTVEPEAAVKED